MRSPKQVLDAARARWPSVLRAEAAGEHIFPLVVPFKRPATTGDFATIRAEMAMLMDAKYEWHIDWEEIETRRWGKQRWPQRIRFESIDCLAEALEVTEQLKLFREALILARSACPKLEPWLQRKAHRIPEILPDWKGIVSVCAFFDVNPAPNCFVRQLPISVGTKFIEEHRGILGELLAVVLGDRVNPNGLCFEERFHLRVEPTQVRFRFLDISLRDRAGWPVTDCTISTQDLANLTWSIPRVLIVENKAVFLCLPDVADTLAILGNGKAATLLCSCSWLHNADIVYWGDCDEAGFGILSLMRATFPKTRSILMDHDTWKSSSQFTVAGRNDASARFDCLTEKEIEALKQVVAESRMLEQERIPLGAVEQAIRAVFPDRH